MKKYFVRCCSQNDQNITLKIKAESEDAARDEAYKTYKVKQVFNISEETPKVNCEWGRKHSSPHIIQRKGKYLTVFC